MRNIPTLDRNNGRNNGTTWTPGGRWSRRQRRKVAPLLHHYLYKIELISWIWQDNCVEWNARCFYRLFCRIAAIRGIMRTVLRKKTHHLPWVLPRHFTSGGRIIEAKKGSPWMVLLEMKCCICCFSTTTTNIGGTSNLHGWATIAYKCTNFVWHAGIGVCVRVF